MANFANLLKSNKTFSVSEEKVSIRKHNLAFAKYFLIKARELYNIVDGNVVGANKGSQEFKDLDIEFVKEALVSWTFKNTEGSPVPITEENLEDLLINYPEVFALIHAEIELFNSALDEESKKNSQP